ASRRPGWSASACPSRSRMKHWSSGASRRREPGWTGSARSWDVASTRSPSTSGWSVVRTTCGRPTSRGSTFALTQSTRREPGGARSGPRRSGSEANRRRQIMATLTMKELLEAGVHFGHQTKRWNPKMQKYIFGERNGIYIIDLQKTLKKFREAYAYVRDLAASGGTLLFVGTKKQAQESVFEEATRCGMFYVNHRWLGGTLTNLATIRNSIARL